ncbi:MAG: ribosome assembly factor SBDS [Desulfurococcales archaeon]|nr:ribosome assembly factor SBDS [Desulfurococcales archaeon]MEB3799001.1 ribosome assembly factor SBDS [Desulfurococcales archaeon]MEB3845773.1 ribosome assembly factor SBDS [Desulfurococcales archaeon]
MSSHEYVIAKIELGGHRFEILVNPDLAFKYKNGEKVNWDDLLVSDTVYRDARKGLKASPESVRKTFGTEDIKKIADIIIKQGELQLTAAQRRQLLEAKKRQIINYIAKNAVDPKTKLPIPVKRIENLFDELRISVDLNKSAEAQAVEAVKRIARVIPIKLARAIIRVVIPPEFSGRAYSELSRLGELKKTDWRNDGSLVAEIEIPAGAQNDVINEVNRLTKGRAQVQIKVVD